MVADRITYFADVILPLSVPNYYSYRVPHELKDQINPGQRVIFARSCFHGTTRIIPDTLAPDVFDGDIRF